MEPASLIGKLEDLTVKNRLKIEDQSITSNWVLTQNNKRWSDAISIVTGSKDTASLTLDDIVTEESYVILQPENANLESKHEPCVIKINLTGQKIASIGVVSEASVLEFFKESEEYAGTQFAELILEDEGATVYLAQLNFPKPTSQASIKFTRTHTDSRPYMYLYGMKLVIENAADASSSLRQLTLEESLQNLEKVNNAQGKSRLTGLPNVAELADYDGNFSTEIDACLRSFMEKALAGRTERPRRTKQEPPESIAQPMNQNCLDKLSKDSQMQIETYIDKKFTDMEQRLMQRIDEFEKKTSEKLDTIISLVSLC